MTRKYFGTDGIRGTANRFPMTADMALKAAMATAHVLLKKREDGIHKGRVLIGKDTRLSCYMIEQAITAGFLAMGMDVLLVGPMPTPAVAMLTRSLRADIGVMISASHNPYLDNGIKFFGADGYKLDDAVEHEIEYFMDSDLSDCVALPDHLGKASRIEDAAGRYIEYIKAAFPKGLSLQGLKIVVDCANGAAYKIAPQTLWELEAEVIALNIDPNGRNINLECGATHTQSLQEAVLAHEAHIGIALDGDADRLIVVDEKGHVVDGDQIMAVLAIALHAQGRLKNDIVVATHMSNMGIEKTLESHGIRLLRTAVGDRYVMEEMRKTGCNLGGEQSGHIIMTDYSTTGDGLLAALQVLAVLKQNYRPASHVLNVFDPFPQTLKNLRFPAQRPDLNNANILTAIKQAEQKLGNKGRVFIRPSGTEPLIRVMIEGEDSAVIEHIADDLSRIITNESETIN
jgi:phosphoglucosamine mutase